VGTTLDIANLDDELAYLEESRLRDIASNLIIPEDSKLIELLQNFNMASKAHRNLLEKLIQISVSRQGSSYALAAYSISEKKFPFLKKSPLWLSSDSRKKSISLLNKMEGNSFIIEEALELGTAKVHLGFDGARTHE
jgi:hypothetical protein